MTAAAFPATEAGAQTGRYLYAVIDAAQEHGLDLAGLDGGMVYTLSDGQVAAVVSDVANRRLRPERRRLAAHHQVLKELAARYAVLPMAFGIIADGPEDVRRILTQNRASFAEGLARVAGRVEMGLRVTWDVPNIFEFFLEEHPDLRQLRDHLFRGGRELTQDEKIELGRQFDRRRNSARETHTETVCTVLAACCREVKENRPRADNEVMSLACLIDRTARAEFELAVLAAANRFDQHYRFDFTGPWPPHSFAEIRLTLE